tara:strand:- start:379 stop:660 length:282 start_codon:yes stop_codon:yes gene_type:complete
MMNEIERLEALIRSKGLCTNCGQSHEGIETVVQYFDAETEKHTLDESKHCDAINLDIVLKEHFGKCDTMASCCDLCLCLNGFTIEHAYWEDRK